VSGLADGRMGRVGGHQILKSCSCRYAGGMAWHGARKTKWQAIRIASLKIGLRALKLPSAGRKSVSETRCGQWSERPRGSAKEEEKGSAASTWPAHLAKIARRRAHILTEPTRVNTNIPHPFANCWPLFPCAKLGAANFMTR
jgi:hypothetical protein